MLLFGLRKLMSRQTEVFTVHRSYSPLRISSMKTHFSGESSIFSPAHLYYCPPHSSAGLHTLVCIARQFEEVDAENALVE
jgi:hypothetical protein